MYNQVLKTKLYVPRVTSRLVSRPSLLKKLDLLCERKLTLLSATAGFGKTTLLAEWIQQQRQTQSRLPVAWLSLDANDNDPARFLAYFVAALQTIDEKIGAEVVPMLKSIQLSSIELLWEVLAIEIAAFTMHFVVILDDYHVIENLSIHNSLSYLLERMPPTMHLVISSRVDPPLRMARLRSNGELGEIRTADLRFNSRETADLLALWLGSHLSTTSFQALEARTEGWVAGLQLAALAMQGLAEQMAGDEAQALSTFVQHLTGNTRFIMDYLVEEVLQRQPENMRRFLLQTSILDRLTAPLCEAVTGSQDSQELLISLEKNNLFLIPLDDERRWYRFHTLFAELLSNFLLREHAAQVAELHRRALAWYDRQGLTAEAIQHALKIPDAASAAILMEKVATETYTRGEVDTLIHWSSLIPEEHLRGLRSLCCSFAWASHIAGRMEQAGRYLQLADQTPANPLSASSGDQGEVEMFSSMLAFANHEYESAIQYASQAVEKLPQQQIHLPCLLTFSLGAAYEIMGQDEAGLRSYQDSKRLSRLNGNRVAELITLSRMGDLLARRGQLHQALHAYQQAAQIGKSGADQFLSVAAIPLSKSGQILYEWNRLEEAAHQIGEGLELSRKLGNPYALLAAQQNLALVLWAQGQAGEARRLFQETQQRMIDFLPAPDSLALVTLQQVRLCIRLGETSAAIQWVQSYGQDWEKGYAYVDELLALARARVWIAQGQTAKALQEIEQAISVARASERWGCVIEFLILQALALESLAQRTAPALTALREALQLAEPEGYYRIFVDETQPMSRLLRLAYRSFVPRSAAAKEKSLREYTARLLEGMPPDEVPGSAPLDAGARGAGEPGIAKERGTGSPAAGIASAVGLKNRPADLIEPLSERELEVLRMIAEGQSNQDIAAKLVLTVGTVKAHTSNIFRKLGVHSRTQAIVEAKQLRLL